MPSINADRLALYRSAEAQILLGQSVRMGERMLQRADLEVVQKTIAQLQAAVDRENFAGSSRFSQADFGGRT